MEEVVDALVNSEGICILLQVIVLVHINIIFIGNQDVAINRVATRTQQDLFLGSSQSWAVEISVSKRNVCILDKMPLMKLIASNASDRYLFAQGKASWLAFWFVVMWGQLYCDVVQHA